MKKSNISRRDFIKGVAVGAASVATMGVLGACSSTSEETAAPTSEASSSSAEKPSSVSEAASSLAETSTNASIENVPVVSGHSWETPPDPIADSDIVDTIEADIVIVGAGIAGVTAACRASELGASVAVIEKAGYPSSRGGHYAAYQTQAMTEYGIENEDKEVILKDWLKMSGNRCNVKLVRLFLDHSSEAFDWLYNKGKDVLNMMPIATRYVGSDYYEYLGTHVIRGEFEDNENNINPPVYFMWKEAEEQGAKFYFETPAEQLVKEGDKVTAVIAKDAEGYKKFIGKKGVVLATGDISGDEEMVKVFGGDLARLPQANGYTPVGMNTGDGHKMGMWAGGQMELAPLPTMIHLIRYASHSFGYLHVNTQGNRFMNEDTWIQAKSIRILTQPGDADYAYSIFDSKWKEEQAEQIPVAGGQFWDDMSRIYDTDWVPDKAEAAIEGYIEREHGFVAETLEDLADMLDVDKENFLATVTRYNELAKEGKDTDFGKRAEILTTIEEGPFYALKVGPMLLAIPGGLEINENLEVLDEKNMPIPGLYAIGNVSGGRYGVDYPVTINGTSHGSAITWGYLLAENLAQ